MNRRKLLKDWHTLRVIALECSLDPRSVARYLRGEPVLPGNKIRIEAALRGLDQARAKPEKPAEAAASSDGAGGSVA